MDYQLECRYFLEKSAEFAKHLEEYGGSVEITEDHRVYFTAGGRPFEIAAWINEEFDMLTITTRTEATPPMEFTAAVEQLKSAMQICWDHCVSVNPVENRYDISMALFIGGFNFDVFEGVICNLLACAEAVEEIWKGPAKK